MKFKSFKEIFIKECKTILKSNDIQYFSTLSLRVTQVDKYLHPSFFDLPSSILLEAIGFLLP
jgi:hypothetical protein